MSDVDNNIAGPSKFSATFNNVLGWARHSYNTISARWQYGEAGKTTGAVQEFLVHHATGSLTGEFQRLPVELVHMIANALPVSSAASLALTSRAMTILLGSQYFLALKEVDARAEKLEFLKILERSLPRYRLCHRCVLFHRAETRSSGHRDFLLTMHLFMTSYPCVLDDITHMHLVQGVPLTYWHVQLVMNQYRFGKQHGIPLSTLSAAGLMQDYASDYPYLQATSTPMIIDDELYLRLQSRINVSPRTGVNYSNILFPPLELCRHVVLPLSESLQSKIEAEDFGSLSEAECRHELRGCPECPTEWMMERDNDCSRGGFALVFTTWANLGPGTSPLTAKWLEGTPTYRVAYTENPQESFATSGRVRQAMERAEAESGIDMPSVATEAASEKIRYHKTWRDEKYFARLRPRR